MTREQRRNHVAADRALNAACREAVRILREPYTEEWVSLRGIVNGEARALQPDRRHERAWDVLYNAGTTAELLMGGAA